MADDVKDVYIATEAGDAGWQSLSALAAEQVEAKLPIESVDGKVVLSDSSGSFVVSTGGEESLKVADGVTSVNNRFLVGTSALQAEMGLLKTDASVWDINQPHVYGVGHAVVETINFKQGTNGGYAGYSMSAFRADGMEQSAFIGVVSQDTTTDPAAFGGDVVITTRNDGGQQNELLRLNNQAAEFSAPIQTPSISGVADNDASVTLGAEVEVQTDGRFIVAPQTRGPTLTDAVITAGSWNNSKGARLEFSWPNANGSDYFARAAIRKDSSTADLVYAHYNLTGGEQVQNGHVFYSNVAGQAGVGNKIFEIREGFAAFSVEGVERLVVDDTAAEFSVPIKTPAVSGLASNDASVTLGDQATLTAGDGSAYVPTAANSIATKKYVDDNAGGPAYDDTQIKADLDSEASTRAAADTTLQSNIDAKIWVGTTAAYNSISPKLPGTLYCLTD